MGAGPEKGGVCGWWGVAASQSSRHAKCTSATPCSLSTLRRTPVELFLLRICRTMLTRCGLGKHCRPSRIRDCGFLDSPSVELPSWVNERSAFLIANLDDLVGLKVALLSCLLLFSVTPLDTVLVLALLLLTISVATRSPQSEYSRHCF